IFYFIFSYVLLVSPLSPPSLTHSSPSSSASSLLEVPIGDHSNTERRNEHLAVLLPKQLWKPDSAANTCDNFYCRVPFTFFERKHHCRKCGGVFCAPCTSRMTALLDTCNLSFLQPPRNVPITAFQSPTSPVINSRVCDDCWDQIHGSPSSPHTPEVVRPSLKRVLTAPISMFKLPISPSTTTSPSTSISPSPSLASHMDTLPTNPRRKTQSLHNVPSISSLNSSQSSTSSAPSRPRLHSLRTSHLPLPTDLERSYGELDAYPLRRSSILCKATGGGRWEPKQSPILDGYRLPIPGGKAPFELQMEQEELLERQRRENPVFRDGAFQYRPPREPEPLVVVGTPCHVSTF
ncbi:hypothetical protein CVT24_000557, partial [Panaeolus cyanescens]